MKKPHGIGRMEWALSTNVFAYHKCGYKIKEMHYIYEGEFQNG